jgi:Putative regulator of cell autolysis
MALNTVKTDITNSAMSQVDFYIKNLEKDFDRIRLLQNNLYIDDDLNTLASVPDSLDDIGKLKALLRVQQRLVSIQNSSPYIQEVGVHIPSVNKSIYAQKGVSVYDSNRFLMLADKMSSLSSQFVIDKNQIIISSKRMSILPSNEKSRPKIITEVQLSNRELKSDLTQSRDYDESGLILVDKMDQFFLSTATDTKIINQIREQIENNKESENRKEFTIHIDGIKYMMICSKSDYLDMKLYKYIPENLIFKKMEAYQIWFWFFIIAALVLIVLFSYSTFKLIKEPMSRLVKAFKEIEEGDLSIQIKYDHNNEFKFVYTSFNIMVSKLKQLLEQVYMLKILTQRAELKQLQSQINPHFLYNSFFILYNMVDYDESENVKKFAKQLGNYFQFITRSAAEYVPFLQEVNHARTYAEIQAKRFRNRIKLKFDELPVKYENNIVPRLILQPFIENAFEHGLENKTENGIIDITFHEYSEAFFVCIEDNGDEMTDEAIEELKFRLTNCDSEIECTGMINIHKRVQLKFGSDSGVTVSRSALGGLKVSISIQFKEENANV